MKKKNNNFLKKIIILLDKYIFFSLIKTIYLHLKSFFISSGMTFNGWGMITYTNLPWQDTKNQESVEFEKINKKLIMLVKKKEFVLSQILKEEKNQKKKNKTCSSNARRIKMETLYSLHKCIIGNKNFKKKN